MMTPRPKGSNYDAWFAEIQAKFPDARARTTGEHGWSTLSVDAVGPSFAPHDGGPHYTDVSAKSYSTQRLVGSFDHNTNKGEIFVGDWDKR